MGNQQLEFCYHSEMNDLSEIRRLNFQKLLDEFKMTHHKGREHGALSAFARYYEMNPNQCSLLRTGANGIGDGLARRIEEKTGKPTRWLDDEHHLVDMSDPAQVSFVDVAMTLFRASPEHAKDALLQIARDIVAQQNAKKKD